MSANRAAPQNNNASIINLGIYSHSFIVLELLTDPREAGPELAEWIIANVPCESARRDLQVIFDELLHDLPVTLGRPAEQVRRVVIFGGHQRDESKMTRSLFGDSVFDVRWRPCEKSQGSPDAKLISQAIEHADAVILIIGRLLFAPTSAAR